MTIDVKRYSGTEDEFKILIRKERLYFRKVHLRSLFATTVALIKFLMIYGKYLIFSKNTNNHE
jgi:hypothetical protein